MTLSKEDRMEICELIERKDRNNKQIERCKNDERNQSIFMYSVLVFVCFILGFMIGKVL